MAHWYYDSEDWKWVREQVWKRHGRKCWLCGTSEPGQYDCHHKSYTHFGLGNHLELDDVELLCRSCHIKESKRLGHGKFKQIPTPEQPTEVEDYFNWD